MGLFSLIGVSWFFDRELDLPPVRRELPFPPAVAGGVTSSAAAIADVVS